MNERDAVVEAARKFIRTMERRPGFFAEATAHGELQEAVNTLDALPASGLKWGCVLIRHERGASIDSHDGKSWLRLTGGWHQYEGDDTKPRPEYIPTFATESAALAALEACKTPPPGWVEPVEPTTRTITDAKEIIATLDALQVGAKVTAYCEVCKRAVTGPVMRSLTHGWNGVARDPSASLCRDALTSLTFDPRDLPAAATPAPTVEPVTREASGELVGLYHRLEKRLDNEEQGRREADAALRRDVDGLMATLETTSAEAIRANVRITRLNIEQRLGDDKPTPAPTEALPFGCVARQKPDGNWQVENTEGTYWWSNTPSEGWQSENMHMATNRTRESALANFHATNKGVPPPTLPSKPARYEVSPGESCWRILVPGADLVTASVWYEANGGKNASHPIALAVAAALNATVPHE